MAQAERARLARWDERGSHLQGHLTGPGRLGLRRLHEGLRGRRHLYKEIYRPRTLLGTLWDQG